MVEGPQGIQWGGTGEPKSEGAGKQGSQAGIKEAVGAGGEECQAEDR